MGPSVLRQVGTNVLSWFPDGGGGTGSEAAPHLGTCGLGPQGADGYQVLRKNQEVQLLRLCSEGAVYLS